MQLRTASYHTFISIFHAKQFHDSYTCRSAYFLQIWVTPCWRISLAKHETQFSASAFRANLYEYCTINFSFLYIYIYKMFIHDIYIYILYTYIYIFYTCGWPIIAKCHHKICVIVFFMFLHKLATWENYLHLSQKYFLITAKLLL